MPPWRAELERLRGMVRERQCLAGEELQRLPKLEELDALRSGVVGRNSHLLIPDEVAECMRIRGGSHHPSGHWRLDAESGDWECEDPTGYTAGSGYILAAIDGAGAAVLARNLFKGDRTVSKPMPQELIVSAIEIEYQLWTRDCEDIIPKPKGTVYWTVRLGRLALQHDGQWAEWTRAKWDTSKKGIKHVRAQRFPTFADALECVKKAIGAIPECVDAQMKKSADMLDNPDEDSQP